MSDTQLNSVSGGKGRPPVSPVKDAALLLGWIAGLIIIAGLVWFLTQSARNTFLLKAVNQVLEQSGDSRRLEAPLPPGAYKTFLSGMGIWYTISENAVQQAKNSLKPVNSNKDGFDPGGRRAFVFTFIAEGTFFPCIAVVNSGGKVEEFISLNSYGEKILKRLPAEIIRMYTRRIEGAKEGTKS